MARHGPARGILDFTSLEAVDVPLEVVLKRSAGPALLEGQARVIVAPREPVWAMNRMFAAHSLYRRGNEPLSVHRRDHLETRAMDVEINKGVNSQIAGAG